jgi:hypothetical protein
MRQDGISRHILPASATMLGVCTTLIGLVKVVEARIGPSHVDEYAGLAALVFLASSITSYLSFRQGVLERYSGKLERLADTLFIMGLLLLTAVSTLFAYEVI